MMDRWPSCWLVWKRTSTFLKGSPELPYKYSGLWCVLGSVYMVSFISSLSVCTFVTGLSFLLKTEVFNKIQSLPSGELVNSLWFTIYNRKENEKVGAIYDTSSSHLCKKYNLLGLRIQVVIAWCNEVKLEIKL